MFQLTKKPNKVFVCVCVHVCVCVCVFTTRFLFRKKARICREPSLDCAGGGEMFGAGDAIFLPITPYETYIIYSLAVDRLSQGHLTADYVNLRGSVCFQMQNKVFSDWVASCIKAAQLVLFKITDFLWRVSRYIWTSKRVDLAMFISSPINTRQYR